ncbi:MAG TPA: Gfo/Idh/MocA family oxidoreductase [Chitinophagaceae bacterium]|jgi:predicted dehydrogenase|nr:Gfo/Idh/MocA family oxidoreductase [Chitinophagaceae bacterium]
MKHQPIKTGLLAYGMSGRLFHAPFISTHPGFNFMAVTERSQKKVNQIYPSVRSYNTADELINDSQLELIIINTPNSTHFDYAKQALEAGKHVLIEKPLAVSVAKTQELYDLAEKQQRYVMAYQNRRWDSDFQSVKIIIESNKLGKLTEVYIRFDRYKPVIEAKAFKENPGPGSGLAFNLGPHVLDQAICLFGKPVSCNKTTAINRVGSQVDDYAFFYLKYPGDLQVYVCVSLLTARALPAFVVHGRNGSFIKERTDIQESQLDQGILPDDKNYGTDATEGELTLYDEKGKKTVENISTPQGNYSQLFEAVYQQVRNGHPYPITKEHILWQMEILEQKDV